jgi:hypothetical protein
VLLARKFNGRFIFEKIIVGGLFLILLFQQPTLIFSKTFLPLNLRAGHTKLMQKLIERKLDTSEVMAEKQFLTNLVSKWHHLEPKWGQRIISNSVLNDSAGNFTLENHV